MSIVPDNPQNGQQTGTSFERGIFISGRQISGIIAGFLFVSFFVFISGYFLGKKKTIEEFGQKIEKKSFADQILSSLCTAPVAKEVQEAENTMQDNSDGEKTEKVTDLESDTEKIESKVEKQVPVKVDNQVGLVENTEKGKNILSVADTTAVTTEKSISVQEKKLTPILQKEYYAELVGFGTLVAAEKCIKKLHKDGYQVVIKKRTSKSAKGRQVNWYQVVTTTYNDKTKLEKLVNAIKKNEKLNDIRIVALKK